MKKLIAILSISLFVFSCGETETKEKDSKNNSKEVKETAPDYIQIGMDVTNTAQSTLLKHVGQAMKMGGPNAAIQYCNINALSITDSLSEANHVKISRVTEKNRNEKNVLAQEDLSIWEYYKTGAINVQMPDTLVDFNGKKVFYRPIYIANPTCLNCHGQQGTDIMDVTVAKLDELYPNDKARDYNMGELRGMWKLEFEK
ncbi:MAG: DUF3365 domain-containing protein [Crocinitomicaceae bacterium]|nr:DUF3365 domain-containing protein [Crocinitomicaceae bacterium]